MPASQYTGQVIAILDKAEGLRLEAQQKANKCHDLTQLVEDPTPVIGSADKYIALIDEFESHARPLAIVAESFGIDAMVLRDFIRTHNPALVTPASDVLHKLQGHALKRELEASEQNPETVATLRSLEQVCDERSALMSKSELARRICNSPNARARDIEWSRFNLKTVSDKKWTVNLNAIGVDAAMRKRLEKPATR